MLLLVIFDFAYFYFQKLIMIHLLTLLLLQQ